MSAVTICSDFGAPKNKVWHCFHCFPIYFPWSDGTRCHDLRFLSVERSLVGYSTWGHKRWTRLSDYITTTLVMCSSVHGILQAKILEWVALSFSRGSSPPRDETVVSCIAGKFFTDWAMREAPIYIWSIHITEMIRLYISLCCIPETNTTLLINYTPI